MESSSQLLQNALAKCSSKGQFKERIRTLIDFVQVASFDELLHLIAADGRLKKSVLSQPE